MDVITIDNVSKKFKEKKVLDALTLNVPKGCILGFVGENGAGKTTTMEIILGLLSADEGKVTIFEEEVVYGNSKTNKEIGYLPDVPEFYNYMSAREYLQLCKDITSNNEKSSNDIRDILNQVGLEDNRKQIGKYSRGMRQRLGLAQALLNKPQILICDEPTSALDPIGRRDFLNILSNIKGDTTILFSTHILSDVESVADYVAILHSGNIKLFGKIDELKSQYSEYKYFLSFDSMEDQDTFISKISKEYLVLEHVENGVVISEKNSVSISGIGLLIIDYLSANKVVPSEFKIIEPSLENIFMEVVK